MAQIGRTPPVEVRRQLRREVGFVCPIPGCGSPFLEYHHFDPKFADQPHHNPDGMIALCTKHHPKGDVDTFTPEQLRKYKKRDKPNKLTGGFEWWRYNLLADVGTNQALGVMTLLHLDRKPLIWFTRDEDQYLRLNIDLNPLKSGLLVMDQSDWITFGEPSDVECLPSGKLLNIRYPDGDRIRIEFSPMNEATALVELQIHLKSELLDFTCDNNGFRLNRFSGGRLGFLNF